MKHPDRLYFVITDYPKLGLGSAGEGVFDNWNGAYDAFVEAVDDDQPTRVLCIDFDPDTSLPEATNDVTFEFASDLGAICAARHLSNPLAAE